MEPVRLPARSPNLNSHLERFHLSLKSECLERMIFFGERHCEMLLASSYRIFTANEIIKGWATDSSNPW